MSMTHIVAVATLVTLFAITTIPGHAQLPTHTPTIAQTERPADDLDPTFGTNGRVISNLTNNTDAADAIVLPDDRILVLGTLYYPSSSLDNINSDLILMRFTSDGIPDPTFGDNGMAIVNSGMLDIARAMVIQPDNKIVVVGYGRGGIQVMRFTSDGALDTTFGEEGIGQRPSDFITIDHIVLQPDGKIVLAGWSSFIGPRSANFVLIRFNADGRPDSTFGENGRAAIAEGDRIHDLVIQPDGKILVAGDDSELSSPQANIIIARYNPDGTKDTTFGEEGVLTIPISGSITQIHLLENNDFLVAMSTPPKHSSIERASNITLTKYRADGSVDPNFRSNEESSIDTGQNEGISIIALTSTGQILLVGSTNQRDDESATLIVRFASDGTIEGAITTDLGKEEFHRQVLVQSDDKFIVVGTIQGSNSLVDLGDSNFFLLRYLNSPFNRVYLPLTSR